MKKQKILIAMLLALMTPPLMASSNSGECCPKKMIAAPCCKQIDPCAIPVNNPCKTGFVTLDFIWWKPHLGAMEYAVSGINDAGANVPNFTNTAKGRSYEPNFAFKPGFKIGFGADLSHDTWDLYGEYTWLQGGTQKNSFSARPGLGAATSFSVVDPTGVVAIMSIESGASQWKQNFNVFDLMMGRNFFVSPYLSLKPSFGLKGAWITEKLNLDFVSSTVQFLSNGVSSATQIRKQNMWGLGARFGLDGVWYIAKNWGIYGNVDGTALWSDFHSRAKTTTDVLVSPGVFITTTNVNNKAIVQEVMAVLEAGIGLTYAAWICDEQYQFQANIGWEEQVWVNFNHFVENVKSGNLSLQGLTLQAGLTF